MEAGSDDAVLLRRLAAGDVQAFGMAYDRWSRGVYACALRLLRDRDEAEDTVEETFWRVWQSAAHYKPSRGSVEAWLLAIARHRALDRMRARQRRADLNRAARAQEWVAERVQPEAPLQFAELADCRSRIERALAELPAEQRGCVELAYFRGMSHAEIAEHTSQPLGTVKTRIRLALRKLRSRLSMLDERLEPPTP